MCRCNELTIPYGPQGAPGINAFKFVKQFTTDDIEQTIVVPYAEWSACGVSPFGCLADGTTANSFIDIHIQLWLYVNADVPYWQLLVNGPPATNFSYTTRINSLTGDIIINTDGNLGNYRLVILG